MATQKEEGKWEGPDGDGSERSTEVNVKWQREKAKTELGIYCKEGQGSWRSVETKSKNVLSDRDLCTEHVGRVEKMVK